MDGTLEFRLNGRDTSLSTDLDRPLLWVLRADLNLTGAKYGCGIGACGACTVLVNNKATRSCLVNVGSISGKEVTTIEGLATGEKLHPIQQAFIDQSALQCGFCTPGMILRAYAWLAANPNPTEAEVIEGMNANLCRCGAHPRIVQAILNAAQTLKGGAQ